MYAGHRPFVRRDENGLHGRQTEWENVSGKGQRVGVKSALSSRAGSFGGERSTVSSSEQLSFVELDHFCRPSRFRAGAKKSGPHLSVRAALRINLRLAERYRFILYSNPMDRGGWNPW